MNVDAHRVYVHIEGGWAFIGLPLRNVGRGLATINEDDVRLFGGGLGHLEECEVLRERVPPQESSRILCTSHYDHASQVGFPHSLQLLVPYRDFAGGQLTVAVFELAQHSEGEPWALRAVKQAAPADIALPSGAGSALPRQ